MSLRIDTDILTPHQLVKKLDEDIIGQHEAKKSVAIAYRNHSRKEVLDKETADKISPHNILLIGPTGCGKTGLARLLAVIGDRVFITASATEYTEQGYVGKSVEEIIRKLGEAALNFIKKTLRKEFNKEKPFFEDKVDKVILDSLIAPSKNESANESDAKKLYEKTREGYLKKIKEGKLDNAPIEIEVLAPQPSLGVISGGPIDEGMMTFANQFMSRFAPPRRKKRKTTVAEARKTLLDEEFDRWTDAQNIKEKAHKAAERGVVYIDEIDKTNQTQGGKDSQVSRIGTQRDLVGLIGGMTSVKTVVGEVKTDGILFIAGGAFHNSKPSDLMPELQGRFPVRVKLNSLTEEDLYQILLVPRNSILKQLTALLGAEDVNLEFTNCAARAIAKKAHQLNIDHENIGARRLISVCNLIAKNPLYDTPEKNPPGTTIKIDKRFVKQQLEKVGFEPVNNDYFL